MSLRIRINRRGFLQMSAMASSMALLAACGGGAADGGAPAAGPAGSFMDFEAANAEQWGRIPADHQIGTLVKEADWYKILGDAPADAVEVAGFMGGWGELWIDAVIESMKQDFAGINLNKDFDPRIWEKMKPRLVAGEVPDWN